MMSSSSTCTDVPAAASEQLCYIHCNFCNIVLAVSVPCSSLFDTVTVRCGNCTNMWPVNVGMATNTSTTTSSTSTLLPDYSSSSHFQQQAPNHIAPNYRTDLGFSSDRNNKISPVTMTQRPNSVTNAHEININRPQEKRQRVPSLYNRFIKEEIQRIKASNPDISHKEAFSTAAKNAPLEPSRWLVVAVTGGWGCSRSWSKAALNNTPIPICNLWAHFPHIQFGLAFENNHHLLNQADENQGLR